MQKLQRELPARLSLRDKLEDFIFMNRGAILPFAEITTRIACEALAEG
ncbi:MAG: hypothetical protein IKK66_00035 [Ruminococcus sp.]|nr:hypothetical protein [Ruminococcus sp.]